MAIVALGVALMSIWFGLALIHRSIENRLIREVLFEWRRLGQTYAARGGRWPVFDGSNHAVYMRELQARLQREGLISLRRARRLSFAPRVARIGRRDERLFLLLLPGRMVVFGLTARTFARIDRQVDGAEDPARGSFTGRPASDGHHMIGNWQL